MTEIPFAQIDAFASKPFEGNQACVMPLGEYLPDETLQKIAAENNVAETAFNRARRRGALAAAMVHACRGGATLRDMRHWQALIIFTSMKNSTVSKSRL